MNTPSGSAPVQTSETRLPAVVSALPGGLPSLDELFAFAAEAERRVHTLRLRIEDRSITTRGESLSRTEILVDRPRVRVTTSTGPAYEVWTTDGATIEQYNAASNTATRRPHRAPPTGLDDAELPATASHVQTLGPLPGKGWASTFLRPAHFCANTLRSGTLGAIHESTHLDRAALIVEAAAPRVIDRAGDHATFRYRVTFDRATGILLGVSEIHDERVVREAHVSAITLDAPIPASEFVIEMPEGVTKIY
jgi:outer membrane lipoprotein-sorting protein